MSPQELIRDSAIAAIVTNARVPDNPIVACNAAFARLTGYAESEIVGRNCRFLAGPDTDPGAARRLGAAVSGAQPTLVELLNYRKDGTAFRNAVMIAPVFDENGDVTYFIGSQMDAGAAPSAKAAVRLAALSPRQREVLLAMAAGQSSKQIAHELGLAERTVKMHRSGLIRALGVRAAVEAIRVAIEAGH